MKLNIVAFTQNGMRLGERIFDLAQKEGWEAKVFVKSRYVSVGEGSPVNSVETTLSEWAQQHIPDAEALIFIGAAGIAVRTIAPFIKSKTVDPAVMVLDEKGNYVIPLLSGHIGGANELALWLSEKLLAVPVLTTATDVNHKFAVDVFAKKNQLWISSMKLAKEVSARILGDEELPMGCGDGCLDAGHENSQLLYQNCEDGKKATFWIHLGEGEYLHLVPAAITLGIGCRKGTSIDTIERVVGSILTENGIFPQGIEQIASIDLKKEEPGILQLAEKWGLPFVTYSSEQLKAVHGEFTASPFVQQVTGVDNVCERSAVLGSRMGELIVRKQAQDGVTAACAVREWRVKFE
ncbi:MAG: cobalt-precorrin 5A hydrolase [Oliverpabstia sp.]